MKTIKIYLSLAKKFSIYEIIYWDQDFIKLFANFVWNTKERSFLFFFDIWYSIRATWTFQLCCTYVILPHLIRSIVLVCQRFQILRLGDPVEVSLQILFQLLFLSKFLEVPTVLGLLSFFGELSGKIRILVKIIIKKELYNDDNVVMYVTELILWKLRTLHKTNWSRSYNSRKIAAGSNS